jgi:hypothetical protein
VLHILGGLVGPEKWIDRFLHLIAWQDGAAFDLDFVQVEMPDIGARRVRNPQKSERGCDLRQPCLSHRVPQLELHT